MKDQSSRYESLPDPPVLSALQNLQDQIDTALPDSAEQFAVRLFKEKWGQDIDPRTSLLVRLDYDYHGHPPENGVHQGQIASSQPLLQALLANYQILGDGRFGENAFGMYTPPDVGPSVRIVPNVDEFAEHGSGNHQTYEGIYRRTVAQVFDPITQIPVKPADFKKWVWNLDLKERYQDYLDLAWPTDEQIVRAEPYALRTSVKSAFIMSACLQFQEGSLSQEGISLSMLACGLPAEQHWSSLTSAQFQIATRVSAQVQASRLTIYRYASTDIWCFRQRASSRLLLYIPGNSSPLHEFIDVAHLREWIVVQAKTADSLQALALHFAEHDRKDGTFHAGVVTALQGMAIYPQKHRLTKEAGFFNDDGYWAAQDYIDLEGVDAAIDPFAHLVLTMKRAAMASVRTIRDDAQVNRDNLSAVVEPLVRWINQFGPLALFAPGGEGLMALAGLIDAGYGIDQTINGQSFENRAEGLTRTVFGLLNALPLIGAVAALSADGTSAGRSAETLHELAEPPREPLPAAAHGAIAVRAPAQALTRLELIRGVCSPFASFSDEVLGQIAKVTTVDDDMLRLMQVGRPPTPLLMDAIDRFKLDQALQTVADPAMRAQLFSTRYQALQRSEQPWVQLFQREYPGLPKAVVEQILDRSGVEISHPVDPVEAMQVLKRLDAKARQYHGHVRLNRAYEGLFLRTIVHAESDVLALHSVERLSGWPRHVRIEVLDGSVSGRVLDRCGPLDAPDCRRLIKIGERYRSSSDADTADKDADLISALLGVLTDQERDALALRSLDPGGELRLLLTEHLMSRNELMLGLGRMDSGLPFRFEGLRGGGFPPTPQDAALVLSVRRLEVRELYPDFSDTQVDELLRTAGSAAQALLESLNLQLQQLRVDLTFWVDQSLQDADEMDLDFLALGDPQAQDMNAREVAQQNVQMLQDVIAYERQSRTELADELIAIWQKRPGQNNSLFVDEAFAGYKLNLDFEDYHRLPALNLRFHEVVELSMDGMHLTARQSLNAFLESFPNLHTLNLHNMDLRQLNADRVPEGNLPRPVRHMIRLKTLNLSSTHMTFKDETAGQLCELVGLQSLDLSDNPLEVPPMVLGLKELRVLNLRNTRITHCPVGIADEPYLTCLDLRDNRIIRVPDAVLNQAIVKDRLRLAGNPLTDEDTLIRLINHRERTGINLWLSQPDTGYGSAAPWLVDGDERLRVAGQDIWQRLATSASGPAFLRVMDGLSLTADFRVGRRVLEARVWRMLRAADASQELWGLLRQCVEITVADAEDPFRLFNRLEDTVRLHSDWVSLNRPIPMPVLPPL